MIVQLLRMRFSFPDKSRNSAEQTSHSLIRQEVVISLITYSRLCRLRSRFKFID